MSLFLHSTEITPVNQKQLGSTSLQNVRLDANTFTDPVSAIRFRDRGAISKFNPTTDNVFVVRASNISVRSFTEPNTPTDVSADAKSESQIDVSFAVDPPGHDGLLVLRSTQAGGPYTEVSSTVDESDALFSDTGLPTSAERFYALKTFLWDSNVRKESTASAEVSAVTGGGGSAPGAPGQPSATESSTARTEDSAEFNISWAASSGTVTEYEYYAGHDSCSTCWTLGSSTSPIGTGSTAPNTTVTSTRGSTDFDLFFCVRGKNGNGVSSYTCNSSPSTNFVSVPGNLTRPTGLTVSISSDDASLEWSDMSNLPSAGSETAIERRPGSSTSYTEIDTVAFGTTTYADNNLAEPSTYFWRVRHRSTDTGEVSAYSNAVSKVVSVSTGSGDPDFPNEPTATEWPNKVVVAENQFDSLPPVDEEWTDAIAGTWSFDAGSPNTSHDSGESDEPQSPPNAVQTRYPDGWEAGRAPVLIRGWDVFDFSRAELKHFYGSWHFRFHGPSNSDDYENQSTATKMFFIGVARSMGESANELFPALNGKGEQTVDTSFGFSFRQQQPVTHNTFSGFQVTMGDWHQLEIRLEINDIGSANGVVKVWIDGTLVIDESDYEFRTADDPLGFHFFKWNPTWGGSSGVKTRDDFYLMGHIRLVGEPI